jgi:TonB family protein
MSADQGPARWGAVPPRTGGPLISSPISPPPHAAVLPVNSTALQPAQFAAPSSILERDPDWERLPDGDQFAALFPHAAEVQHENGRTKMSCRVRADGALTQCVIIEETPTGLGFGDAALAAARYFKMRQRTVGGAPVAGGLVIVPLRWSAPSADGSSPRAARVEVERADPTGAAPAAPSPPRKFAAPDWERMPDAEQMASYFPPAALAQHASGRVRMTCKVRANGTLTDCAIVKETPPGLGFGQATLAVAKYFKMRPTMMNGRSVEGAMVSVSINWTPPE